TKAMLTLHADDPARADGVIMVDVGKPVKPTEREMAQSMAGDDGTILPSPVDLDGIEAMRVETSSRDATRPRYCVVVIREGRLYLVMAAEAHGTDVAGAFEHVLKTWRWS